MLSDEIIEKVTERLVERMNNANLFVIKRIARKIKQIRSIVPSSSNDIIQVMDYGGDLDKIVRELSKATSLTVKEIYELFEEVAKADQHFAKKYYEYKKKKFIPYEENQRLKDEVEAVARMTAENFINLSQTRGIGYVVKDKEGNLIFKDVSTLYKDVVDEGIISISQGKSSFDDEMSKLIKQIGKSGLKSVVYESGRTRRIDSALRMNISDGIRELRHKTQEIYGEEFGADGWEITVHGYPAPDHAEVQGRQFSKEEFDKFQNDEDAKSYDGKLFPAISEETGHDRRSIGQYNCYHNTFAIVLGVTKPTYSEEQLRQIIEDNEKGFMYGDKHYTLYEGSQLQRKIETEIRKQKDIQIMGVESNNKDVAEEAQREIDRLVNEYYELSKTSGLPTRLDRIQVEGYKEIDVSDIELPEVKTPTKVEKVERKKNKGKWIEYDSLPRWYQIPGTLDVDKEGKELIDWLNDYGDKDNEASKVFASKIRDVGNSDGTHNLTLSEYKDIDSQFRRTSRINTLKIPRLSDKENKLGSVETTLHETWHGIDYYKGSGMFGATYSSDNTDLYDVIVRDNRIIGKEALEKIREYDNELKGIADRITDNNKYLYDELNKRYFNGEIKYSTYRSNWNKINNQIKALIDYEERNYGGGGINALEDIYDALSGGRARDQKIIRYGHGTKYYRNYDRRSEEIFANYCMLSMTHPELIELLRKDKSELCDVLDEMLRSLL